MSKGFLWFDEFVALEGDPNLVWYLPVEDYFDVGNNKEGLFTIEYVVSGPAAASGAGFQLQTSAAVDDNDDAWRDILTSAVTLSGTTPDYAQFEVGSGAASASTSRLRGRLRFSLTPVSATDWCSVRVRIWAALQSG